MKKSFVFLSGILMIIGTITTGFSSNNFPGIGSVKVAVNYQVNIHLGLETQLCNTYLVEVVDGNGVPVAPAKPFVSGVSRYVFSERGPVTGTRVAVLIKAPYDYNVCTQGLVTPPDVITGSFLNGRTYIFDLYPEVQTHH